MELLWFCLYCHPQAFAWLFAFSFVKAVRANERQSASVREQCVCLQNVVDGAITVGAWFVFGYALYTDGNAFSGSQVWPLPLALSLHVAYVSCTVSRVKIEL